MRDTIKKIKKLSGSNIPSAMFIGEVLKKLFCKSTLLTKSLPSARTAITLAIIRNKRIRKLRSVVFDCCIKTRLFIKIKTNHDIIIIKTSAGIYTRDTSLNFVLS